MSTTTIRLPEELKTRVAQAAEQAGTSAHSFILQAIAEKTTSAELQREFSQTADARYANILATGKTISWDQMRSYLESHAAGQPDLIRPSAKKLAR